MQVLVRRSITIRGQTLQDEFNVSVLDEVGRAFEIQFQRHARGAHTVMTVTELVDVPEDVRSILEDVGSYTLQAGEPSPSWILGDEPAKGTEMRPLGDFPPCFQDWVRAAGSHVLEHGRRFFRLLRWRYFMEGEHAPFSVGFLEWSLGGDTWHALPTQLHADLRVTPQLRPLKEEAVAEICGMTQRGADEPLAHIMLREAASHEMDSPRSAVVMAVAAVEVAIKQSIAELAPKARWLVEKSPLPPLVAMLKDYLPGLASGEALVIPKAARRDLQAAIEERNRLVHRPGSAAPSAQEVEGVLRSARDILWLCDFYCGNTWAKEHMTPEFRSALQASDRSG